MSFPLIKRAEAHDYPDAGKDAPEPVKKLIDEWRALPVEERADKPLLYWILGSGTPPYKMTKEDSLYVDDSKIDSQTCANCEFAYKSMSDGKFICSQISGNIEPEGWCKLWVPGKKE